jgi:hypothetical protein
VERLDRARRESKEPAAPGGSKQAAAAAAVSNRQARKEQARRERERRIRQARRRARIRRAVRVGLVLGVAGAVGTFFWLRSTESDRVKEQAAQAAEALGCGDIQEFPSEGRTHLQGTEPLPDYQTTPANSGPHQPSPYQGAPVITADVDPLLESALVHNLEHGYVIMYYQPDGDEALPSDVRERLADLARSEDKVLLAPYPKLPKGTSLTFAAWTRLQKCPTIPADEGTAAVDVARGFIEQFRGGGEAPEPGGI